MMNNDLSKWLFAGYFISIVIGHPLVSIFNHYLRSQAQYNMNLMKWPAYPRAISALVIGTLERTFFTTIVAFNIGGSAVAMITWTVVKIARYWGNEKITLENSNEAESQKARIGYGYCSIVSSLFSMLIALIGGLICKYGLMAYSSILVK